MILVDANLLVYAHVAMLPQHEPSRRWLDERLNGTAAVGLPWQSLLGFVRLVTSPRVFERPLSMTDAWKQVESWLGCAVVRIPVPTERHAEVLGPLLAQVSRPNLVPAAHLAAIEHGLISVPQTVTCPVHGITQGKSPPKMTKALHRQDILVKFGASSVS